MLARMTATIMGNMWDIWPVSSKQITAVETVCVTAPVIAAAPDRKQDTEDVVRGKLNSSLLLINYLSDSCVSVNEPIWSQTLCYLLENNMDSAHIV